jgi:mRNA interferase MazF
VTEEIKDARMVDTIKTTVSIQKTLFDQAETLAQQLNISQSHLFGVIIEDFIKSYQSQLLDEINKKDQPTPNEQAEPLHQNTKTAAQIGEGQKVINQGDIYWARLENPGGLQPDYAHPHVVIQDNVFNRSRINTVVVCALTSNMKRANEPGNVLLEVGEANLSRQSVVVVSQVSTIDETQLGEYIGSLTGPRINQILAGMRFQQVSFFAR